MIALSMSDASFTESLFQKPGFSKKPGFSLTLEAGKKPGFLEKPGFSLAPEAGKKPGFLEKPGFWNRL